MEEKIIPATGIAAAAEKELNIPDPIKTTVAQLLEDQNESRPNEDHHEGDK